MSAVRAGRVFYLRDKKTLISSTPVAIIFEEAVVEKIRILFIHNAHLISHTWIDTIIWRGACHIVVRQDNALTSNFRPYTNFRPV